MSGPNGDRNLFVGIMALQLSMITDHQLLEAMKAWAFEKDRQLEDILVRQGAIDANARVILVSLLASKQSNLISQAKEESELRSFSTIYTALRRLSEFHDSEATRLLSQVFVNEQRKDVDSDPTEPHRSNKLTDRFQIVRALAKGGIGQVSIAEDLELHREVALKEIQAKYLNSEDLRRRFLIEAEITGRLEHPGVVPVYSLGKSSEGTPFYAMQLVRGESLSDAIRSVHSERVPLSSHAKQVEIRKLVTRLVDVCNAVHYAHSKGVLHRDIKPGNIMLGKFGETFVVDWGLARTPNRDSAIDESNYASVLIPSGDDAPTPTRQGTAVGTPEYMSPEQAAGRLSELSPASDVFSLGATLYCILTGKHPTSENENTDRSLNYGKFLTPIQLYHEAPRALSAICMKALATDVSARYSTVDDFSADLDAWLADEPVQAYREPLKERTARWLRTHRTMAATIAGITVTCLLASVLLLVRAQQHNRELFEANQKISNAISQIAFARDEAVHHMQTAKELAINQIHVAEETLSQPELSTENLLQLRYLLTKNAFENFQRWHQAFPDDRNLTNEFAFTARVLANFLRSAADFKKARELIDLSLHLKRQLGVRTYSNQEKYEYVLTMLDSNELYLEAGQLPYALTVTDECSQLLATISSIDQKDFAYLKAKATTQFQRASILETLGRYPEAMDECKNTIEQLQVIIDTNSSSDQFRALHAFSLIRASRLLAAQGKLGAAIESTKLAMTNFDQPATLSLRDFRLAHVTLLNAAAEFRIRNSSDLEQAAKFLDTAIQMATEELERYKYAGFLERRSNSYRLRGQLYLLHSNFDQSLTQLDNAKADADLLLSRTQRATYLAESAEISHQLALVNEKLGNHSQALELLATANSSIEKALAISPESVDFLDKQRMLREENTRLLKN